MHDATPTTTERDSPSDSLPSYSVAEVASILGISTDAVRARIHRGTLDAAKVEGVWRVHLPGTSSARDVPDPRPDPSGARQDATPNAPDPHQDALVEQLRSENAYLRGQLAGTIQQLASERERSDVLQREALGRIEALSAPEIDHDDDQDAGQGDTSSDAPGGVWTRLARFWTGR